MEVREEQFLNALLPILVTLLGIETDVRDLQPENAPSQIVVVPSFMSI